MIDSAGKQRIVQIVADGDFVNNPDEPNMDEVDRRIARLTCLAKDVFRRQDKAARWLRRPLADLAGMSPLEMMETPAGARLVESLLLQYADEPFD